ncbi:MAG: Rrf2 family transcriptional regulator, partial [Planctomycetes bacterium]|nr:Rrf2 family transcriptional regulator [Planctomycetota bacterium]
MKELTAAAVLGLHALHLMLRKAKPVTVREIRRSSRFAPDRIRSVLGRLLKAGLIQGRQGSGYVLARAPGEIALRDV